MANKKKYNDMSIKEQEKYLVRELGKLHKKDEVLRGLLAKVRGGQSVANLLMEERPDLENLKHG